MELFGDLEYGNVEDFEVLGINNMRGRVVVEHTVEVDPRDELVYKVMDADLRNVLVETHPEKMDVSEPVSYKVLEGKLVLADRVIEDLEEQVRWSVLNSGSALKDVVLARPGEIREKLDELEGPKLLSFSRAIRSTSSIMDFIGKKTLGSSFGNTVFGKITRLIQGRKYKRPWTNADFPGKTQLFPCSEEDNSEIDLRCYLDFKDPVDGVWRSRCWSGKTDEIISVDLFDEAWGDFPVLNYDVGYGHDREILLLVGEGGRKPPVKFLRRCADELNRDRTRAQMDRHFWQEKYVPWYDRGEMYHAPLRSMKCKPWLLTQLPMLSNKKKVSESLNANYKFIRYENGYDLSGLELPAIIMDIQRDYGDFDKLMSSALDIGSLIFDEEVGWVIE